MLLAGSVKVTITTSQNAIVHWGSAGAAAKTTDGMAEKCSGVEDQQMCWVGRGQNFARMAGRKVAKVVVTWALNTGIGS